MVVERLLRNLSTTTEIPKKPLIINYVNESKAIS